MKSKRVVLVGTGTGVGKTHVGVALVSAAAVAGRKVVGLKPVESGVVEGVKTDASRLAEAGVFHVKQSPYALLEPISPHLAAEREGVRIRLGVIARWVAEHRADLQVVETAGGLFSPVNLKRTNLDMAARLEPDVVVLVGVDRLGVLHDVRACMGPLEARLGVKVVVALGSPEEADASTGTNATELKRLGTARHVVVFPRSPVVSRETAAAGRALLKRL